MVSWTIRTARSLSSAGCWCPDPCLGVRCFDADMDYILPKNAASIKPRGVHAPFGNGDSSSLGIGELRHLSPFVTGVAVRKGQVATECALVELRFAGAARCRGQISRSRSDANST